MKTGLVLFSYRSHKHGYIEKLFSVLSNRARDYDLTLARGSLNDLQITVLEGVTAIRELMTGKNIRDFDVVYFELWAKAVEQAAVTARYLDQCGKPYFGKELAAIPASTKLSEVTTMAAAGVTVPDTLISSHRGIVDFLQTSTSFSYPLIVKDVHGFGGKQNYLVHSFDELRSTLAANKTVHFIVQEFIPNDCDYRCLVLGGDIKLVIKRTRSNSSATHLNNTSAGAAGQIVATESLPVAARKMVVSAATALGREQFCGVDLMIHSKTKEPYILEVNQSPQIEIGAEVERKMDVLLTYMHELASQEVTHHV